MPAIAALPGATVIPFDHQAAETAIARIEQLREQLTTVRRREDQYVTGVRINWEGPSRVRFEGDRGRAVADLERAITGLATLVDRIREQQHRAAQMQFEANAEEQRARARDLERLAELAARGA